MKKFAVIFCLTAALTACQPVTVAPTSQKAKTVSEKNEVTGKVEIAENVTEAGKGNSVTFADPCTLVSQSELEALVGAPLKKVVREAPTGPNWQTFCNYEGVNEGELYLAQLSLINPALLPSAVTVKGMFDEMKTYVQNPIDVPNVGTSAYHSTGLSGGLVVFDQDLNTIVSLTIGKGVGYKPTEKDIENEAGMVKLIISRLGQK